MKAQRRAAAGGGIRQNKNGVDLIVGAQAEG
jgi:hypothetical protein